MSSQPGAARASDVLVVHGPQAVRTAREFVRVRCLDGAAVPDLPRAERCDVAVLLASELVTNALRHTAGCAKVVANSIGDRLRVVVGDESQVPPRHMQPDRLAENGRGMTLVSALAKSWGVDVGDDGKVVWFEV